MTGRAGSWSSICRLLLLSLTAIRSSFAGCIRIQISMEPVFMVRNRTFNCESEEEEEENEKEAARF